MMLSRKVLVILFLVPSFISLLRLFRIIFTTMSSPPPATPDLPPPSPALQRPFRRPCTYGGCDVNKPPPVAGSPAIPLRTQVVLLTSKELRLLSSIVSKRAPCNLLFFGLHPQLLALSELNLGGRTVFLDDGGQNLRAAEAAARGRFQSSYVYKVTHNATAGIAYDLLRRARKDPACAPGAARDLRSSTCRLALSRLPDEVYEREWDVIVVDGPAGDRPEAPGRMAAIYSAGVMARGGRTSTEVMVHDVDRTVEKWYSREYLCRENLTSSEGRLWHFRVPPGNSTRSSFCSQEKVNIP